jgi:ribosomal protein S5
VIIIEKEKQVDEDPVIGVNASQNEAEGSIMRILAERGFSRQIIQVRSSAVMRKGGRRVHMKAIVVIGNYNGAIGYGDATVCSFWSGRNGTVCSLLHAALVQSANADSAVENATLQAARSLIYVDRFNDHTIYHVCWQFAFPCKSCSWCPCVAVAHGVELRRCDCTLVAGTPRFGIPHDIRTLATHVPRSHACCTGHGLVASPMLQRVFALAGIKDIGSHLYGPPNRMHQLKAVIDGLIMQRTVEEQAHVEGLNVIKLRRRLRSAGGHPSVATWPKVKVSMDFDLDAPDFPLQREHLWDDAHKSRPI